MMESNLPAWVAVPAGILLIFGGLLVVIGSLGLLRLRDFFSRMHPPTMGATLGTGCILFASMLVSTAQQGRPVVHELLITAFIVLTAPVTAILLTRAAVYRMRRKEQARAPESFGSEGGE